VKFSPARRLAVVLVAIALAGCADDSSKVGDRLRAAIPRKEDSSAGSVDLGGALYKPGPLTAVGAVAGTVRLDGDGAAPGMIPVTSDQRVCGITTPGPFEANGKRQLADAVVWIADAKTGKKLSGDKRITVSSEDCAIDPRVQAAALGATVNIFNDDKLLHTIAFVRSGTKDTVLVVPFFNLGQVVPTEKLTKQSGIIEIRCKQHPWTHGYLAVFDHPYFAVSESDGSFNIDSLAPGRYRMMVWHEGMQQPAEKRVKVEEGRVELVDLAIPERR
jgi:hypothetical protein